MRREHAFYSGWCRLFDFHLKRLGLSASAFAERANRSQQAIHSYLSGRARPPLDQVPIWAAMLGLQGAERERFVSAAAEAHVPQLIWRRLQELERAAKAAGPPPPPSEIQDRLTLAEGAIAELVELLRELEALFYTRTVPVDRIRPVRELLGVGIRRAIERHARPRLES
jgi:transcriptional regulator with XRE-family HTH domain